MSMEQKNLNRRLGITRLTERNKQVSVTIRHFVTYGYGLGVSA